MLLHTISGAPRGWRVQVALLFKHIDYELSILSALDGEHQKRPYLDINPRGKVPVLEHEGQFVSDSLGIMAWLDRKFPDRPLFGESANEAGEIWSLATDLEDHMRHNHHAFVFPILVEGATIEKMGVEDRGAMQEKADVLLSEFERLEDRIEGGPYLFGAIPSAADAVAFPDVRLIDRMNEKSPTTCAAFRFDRFKDQFPKLTEWKRHIEALPGFERCLPPHWTQGGN